MKKQRSNIVSMLGRGVIFFFLMILYRLFIPEEREKLFQILDKPPLSVRLNGTRTVTYITPVPSTRSHSAYYTAPAGQKILICNVSLHYDGKDQGTITSHQNHFVMQDGKGEYYRSTPIFGRWVREAQLLNVELNYQGRMRGDVVFVVPQSVEAVKVEYRTFKKESAVALSR